MRAHRPVDVNRVIADLAGLGTITTRKMFGGVYVYCDGVFIATVHDGTLYFKANAGTEDLFIQRGLPRFTYPKDGGIASLCYYRAPDEVFQSKEQMHSWGEVALRAARDDAKRKKPQPTRGKVKPA